MARPRKDVSTYCGQQIAGTKLTLLREAGRDPKGRILMMARCDCGKERDCEKEIPVVLSQVLSGHTKSCGCLKHQRHVEYTQGAVESAFRDSDNAVLSGHCRQERTET